jgi:hypothetical protein
MLPRALAVVSAVLLVASVALATFGPQTLSLGEALYLVDHTVADDLLTWAHRTLGDHVATVLLQSLLLRPAWLVPASAGIICTGFALSLMNRKPHRQSHRRS